MIYELQRRVRQALPPAVVADFDTLLRQMQPSPSWSVEPRLLAPNCVA